MNRKQRRQQEKRDRKNRRKAEGFRHSIENDPRMMKMLDGLIRDEICEQQERFLFLAAISVNEAFGIGAKRMEKFLECLNANLMDYNRMRDEVDKDFADGKLKARAEQVFCEDMPVLYSRELKNPIKTC